MTSATTEEKARAEEIIQRLTSDPLFMKPGRRNDDAVDLCIALRVLGHPDPLSWFQEFVKENDGRFSYSDLARGEEHIERIAPYAESWGPIGNEGEALDYCIN